MHLTNINFIFITSATYWIEIKSPSCRLHALGLTHGTKIKIKQKCLFKGPCILEMNGQNLSIRGCDACQIFLEESHG